MSKVKIQTTKPTNFGRTISYGSLNITFNRAGIAEVESQEVANKLFETYSWLKPEGYTKEFKKKEVSEDVEELQQENEILKQKLEASQGKLKATETALEDWKDIVDDLKEKKVAAETELSDWKTVKTKEIEELQLKVTLSGKNLTELREYCNTLEIDTEKSKGLAKDALIDLILNESRNK